MADTDAGLWLDVHGPTLLLAAAGFALAAALIVLAVLGRRPQQHLVVNGVGKRSLPRKIILVRHAESLGNVDHMVYASTPDSEVPLTDRGKHQAFEAGLKIRQLLTDDGQPFRIFCVHSPYRRTIETSDKLRKAFTEDEILGVQEEVQLREQDFGNFQNVEHKKVEKAERLKYGRFFYRFPNGESGADVYDRMTIMEDHLIRDINAGRFPKETVLILITHGLALRIFLMRWFHWTVEQMLSIWNPENAEPIVLECISTEADDSPHLQTKAMYRLSTESRQVMKGCNEEMCSSSRYYPLRARFAFENVGARSLVKPLARIPSIQSQDALHPMAHVASPDTSPVAQTLHRRKNGASWGISLTPPGEAAEDGAIQGLRTTYVG